MRAGIKSRFVLSLAPHELAQACKVTDWQQCFGGPCVTFNSILRTPLSKMLNNRAQTVGNCVRFPSSFMSSSCLVVKLHSFLNTPNCAR
jgi:hypothetical protein